MGGNSIVLSSIKLANTKSGLITISRLENPYGKNTNSIISIGISLKGDTSEADWKTHIPYENLQEVINALQNAQKTLI